MACGYSRKTESFTERCSVRSRDNRSNEDCRSGNGSLTAQYEPRSRVDRILNFTAGSCLPPQHDRETCRSLLAITDCSGHKQCRACLLRNLGPSAIKCALDRDLIEEVECYGRNQCANGLPRPRFPARPRSPQDRVMQASSSQVCHLANRDRSRWGGSASRDPLLYVRLDRRHAMRAGAEQRDDSRAVRHEGARPTALAIGPKQARSPHGQRYHRGYARVRGAIARGGDRSGPGRRPKVAGEASALIPARSPYARDCKHAPACCRMRSRRPRECGRSESRP
jgi:hypothetical protein